MNEHKKSKEFDLEYPFLLGNGLQILLASIDKHHFNVRGKNGLINQFKAIRVNLNHLNISPNIQIAIQEKTNYLIKKYVEPLVRDINPSPTPSYIDQDDATACKKEIENWINIISKELKSQIGLPIKIFIGHGHNSAWKDLRDHLRDRQKVDVLTYESEERAGFLIPHSIDGMIIESSMALIILTGEIIDTDGNTHARDNVIHELGYCMAIFGPKRTIILLEKKKNFLEPSNIQGIQHIEYNTISESFGNVVATIRREFPSLCIYELIA